RWVFAQHPVFVDTDCDTCSGLDPTPTDRSRPASNRELHLPLQRRTRSDTATTDPWGAKPDPRYLLHASLAGPTPLWSWLNGPGSSSAIAGESLLLESTAI